MPWVYPERPLSLTSKKNVYHSHFTNKEAEMQLYVISPKVLKIANDRVGLHPYIHHSGVGSGFGEQTLN